MAGRARQDWQKEARRRSILAAAEDLFASSGGEVPSVAAVAQRAGLAKGTVYLYFRTKEEIFLALLAWRLGEWMQHMATALRQAPRPLTADDVVDAIVGYLVANPIALRLAVLSHGVLERNIEPDVALAHKREMAEGLRELGAALEAALPRLAAGEGAALLLRAFAYIVGLWQVAEPPAAIKQLIAAEQLKVLQVDFETDLRAGLRDLIGQTGRQAGHKEKNILNK